VSSTHPSLFDSHLLPSLLHPFRYVTLTCRDRIAVLDKTRQILVRNFKNECLKVTTPPLAGTCALTLTAVRYYGVNLYAMYCSVLLGEFLPILCVVLLLLLLTAPPQPLSSLPLTFSSLTLHSYPHLTHSSSLLPTHTHTHTHNSSSTTGIDGLFFAGTSGRLLMKSEDRVVLYDQQARKIIAELQVRSLHLCIPAKHIHLIYFTWNSAPKVPRVKYVIWNKDFSMVALISKHQLVLATKQLDQLCTVTETYVQYHLLYTIFRVLNFSIFSSNFLRRLLIL
jgi:Coatomer WD associated region